MLKLAKRNRKDNMQTLQKSKTIKAKSFKLLAKYLHSDKREFFAKYVTVYMYEAKYFKVNQYDIFKESLLECLSWIHDSAIAESAIPLNEELKEIRVRVHKPILEKGMEQVLALISRELHYSPELVGQRWVELSSSLIYNIYSDSN
jgi:hypothetical protein